jgi:hypothetical protein
MRSLLRASPRCGTHGRQGSTYGCIAERRGDGGGRSSLASGAIPMRDGGGSDG